MGKTRGMGTGRSQYMGGQPCRPRSQRLSFKQKEFRRKRLAELRGDSQVPLVKSDKSLKGSDQGKSSSDVVTSASKPQTPSSRLDGMKKSLGSEVSLLRCSSCMQIIKSDKSLEGSDQDQTTLVSQIDIQEKSSSDIVSSTPKPHEAKHLRSSSKIHKPKASLKKKKKKSSRKAVSPT